MSTIPILERVMEDIKIKSYNMERKKSQATTKNGKRHQ